MTLNIKGIVFRTFRLWQQHFSTQDLVMSNKLDRLRFKFENFETKLMKIYENFFSL